MKTSIATIFASLILTVLSTYGQQYEPLDLAKLIFGKARFSNIDKYVTDEYEGKPNGQDIPADYTTKIYLLAQTERKAVVGMTILDSSGNGVDTYLHFKKDTVWKMSAFRALAMTGLIEKLQSELENMTPKQIDSIIAESKKKQADEATLFTSRAEYDFQLGSAKLTLELDENIIKHFLKNQAEFERLRDLSLQQLEKEKGDGERHKQLIKEFKTDYQKLYIASVSIGGELGNCINFLIGGILDNTVGYIYVKDKRYLPEMNSDDIIMIREIGNGWYIYKTT